MILEQPFIITARLLPGLRIGDGFLSFDPQTLAIYLDTPTFEHEATSFNTGAIRSIVGCFEAILGFMSACAESVQYEARTGNKGENADLFPEQVAQWLAAHNDDINMAQCEISDESGCPREELIH